MRCPPFEEWCAVEIDFGSPSWRVALVDETEKIIKLAPYLELSRGVDSS